LTYATGTASAPDLEGAGEMHFDTYPTLAEISDGEQVHNTLELKPLLVALQT